MNLTTIYKNKVLPIEELTPGTTIMIDDDPIPTIANVVGINTCTNRYCRSRNKCAQAEVIYSEHQPDHTAYISICYKRVCSLNGQHFERQRYK